MLSITQPSAVASLLIGGLFRRRAALVARKAFDVCCVLVANGGILRVGCTGADRSSVGRWTILVTGKSRYAGAGIVCARNRDIWFVRLCKCRQSQHRKRNSEATYDPLHGVHLDQVRGALARKPMDGNVGGAARVSGTAN